MNVRKILMVAAFALIIGAAGLRAQKDDAGQDPDIAASVSKLEDRVAGLQARQEQAQREISAKLDRILANQDRIFKELEIVKVRASLKN